MAASATEAETSGRLALKLEERGQAGGDAIKLARVDVHLEVVKRPSAFTIVHPDPGGRADPQLDRPESIVRGSNPIRLIVPVVSPLLRAVPTTP
jgi:hypothetical protein